MKHAPLDYELPRPSREDESAERFEPSGALRFQTNSQMPTCQGLVYKTFAEPKPCVLMRPAFLSRGGKDG